MKYEKLEYYILSLWEEELKEMETKYDTNSAEGFVENWFNMVLD